MRTDIDSTSLDNIPQQLYKYRDWSNDYHKRILTEREIFFTNVRSFNDPLDDAISLRWDLLTPDQYADIQAFAFKGLNPDTSEQELSDFRTCRLNEFSEMTPEDKQDLIKKHKTQSQDRIGVLSLSFVPDSNPMWAYYANNHQGFCIGFDAKRVQEYNPNNFGLFNVKYAAAFPNLVPSTDNIKNFIDSLCTKSANWAHEEEARFLYKYGSDKAVKFPGDMYQAIHFGCRMPEKDKKEIILATMDHEQFPNVYYIEMTTDPFSFELSGNLVTQKRIDELLAS
ncbi:MAG TPA: DUF2971 domain-containing protein [Saprospiraceae bacterium]|nr:DUF2971 domain-containing protein [Saprospiraceae bacterium]